MPEQVLISIPLNEFRTLLKGLMKEVIQESIEEVPDQPEFITRHEAMKLLKISTANTMIAHERRGILKPLRVGKKIMYLRSEVMEAATKFER
ncbi:MAG: hypothetical protein ACOYXB_00625 [Bacteroidota bacterium]